MRVLRLFLSHTPPLDPLTARVQRALTVHGPRREGRRLAWRRWWWRRAVGSGERRERGGGGSAQLCRLVVEGLHQHFPSFFPADRKLASSLDGGSSVSACGIKPASQPSSYPVKHAWALQRSRLLARALVPQLIHRILTPWHLPQSRRCPHQLARHRHRHRHRSCKPPSTRCGSRG